MSFDRDQEVQEAIIAGETALYSLRDAQSCLNSAGNWGLVDILGGGVIVDLVKHSKLKKARACMETARQDLWRFQQKLNDVNEYLPDIEIGRFLTFADFFFDGLVVDIIVRSKIKTAKEQMSEAISLVSHIIDLLKVRGDLP